MQLAELMPGQRFRVTRIVSGGEIGKRLVDLGFISGAEGEVVRATFFRGPMQISLGDYHLIMRRHEARLVDVELLDSPDVQTDFEIRGTQAASLGAASWPRRKKPSFRPQGSGRGRHASNCH